MIKVKAYADLTKYLSPKEEKHEVLFDNKGEKVKIKDIREYYKIPKEKVHIILLNGRHVEEDCEAGDGDTIVFFSPVGGG